ncbi:MAG: hypothetical protein CSYNP_03740 [Syntrophus sp. SKADARSKE-3]|nr:hypothetical protein [Syntrophus sp. SKADARSKE-3]
MSISKRLKNIRGKMTQREFADTLSVHTNTVARYERGERLPDADYLERVYKRFSISPEWLLTGIGIKNPDEHNKKISHEILSDTERILNSYRDAGVIPEYAMSEDEFSIIKILRALPDHQALEIIGLLLNKFKNNHELCSNKYLEKSVRRLSTIFHLKKGRFEKGIDIDQKIFELKREDTELSHDMYKYYIDLIDSYALDNDKEKFVEKLKKKSAIKFDQNDH